MSDTGIDPTILAILAGSSRNGMRSSYSQKKGLSTYQDPTQVPYDNMQALKNYESLSDVPLWAQVGGGGEGYDYAPAFELPDQAYGSSVYAGRADFTGKVISAALADLENGDDPQQVAAEVNQVVSSSPDAGDFDPEEYTKAVGMFQTSQQKNQQAKQAYDAKYGTGAADRSLGGEQVQYEVPVAKGLPAGPLGNENQWKAQFGDVTPDDILGALDQDKRFNVDKTWTEAVPIKSEKDQRADYQKRADFQNQARADTWKKSQHPQNDQEISRVNQQYGDMKKSRPVQGPMVPQNATPSRVQKKENVVDNLFRVAYQRALQQKAMELASRSSNTPTKAQRALNQRNAVYASFLGG